MRRPIFKQLLFTFIFLSWLTNGCQNKSPAAEPPSEDIIPTPNTPVPGTIEPMDTKTTNLYLALGDSYTIGTSISGKLRFPDQLAEALNTEGVLVSKPIIVAQNGWTTGELLDGIKKSGIQPGFELVTLLIGVNNQYRGYPLDEYTLDFGLLLQKAIEFANGDPSRVIVVSIPDWGVTPFASGRDQASIGAQIDEFNLVNQSMAQDAGVHYVNVTSISRQAANNSSMVATDGLHPSGEQYALWVENILPIALQILNP